MQRGALRLRSRQKYTVSPWQTTRSSFSRPSPPPCPFPPLSSFLFFREHRFVHAGTEMYWALKFCISTCCHAKCNAHAMQKRTAAVTLFVSTFGLRYPPDKGINRITSTGERISASKMDARARAQVQFPRRDTKYAVVRKWNLVFVRLPFPIAYQILQIATDTFFLLHVGYYLAAREN